MSQVPSKPELEHARSKTELVQRELEVASAELVSRTVRSSASCPRT